MSPRTRRLALTAGAVLLSAGCGTPPANAPAALPVPTASAPAADLPPPASAPAGGPIPGGLPTAPVGSQPTQGYPVPGYTYPMPGYTVPTPGYATPPPQAGQTVTAGPLTKSPTPTPTHAPRCSNEPAGARILALIKDDPGVPDKKLAVAAGPYCSGKWTFTTVKIAGQDAGQVEPLMVVTTGSGTKLALVAAGTHVCNAQVQAEAPPGIRVLACGF